MEKKYNIYIVAGVMLIYFGIKGEKFVIWYNGIAVVLGIIAFVIAYIEYRKGKENTDN